MKARVSILIPCRNAEPFLAATLESALAQTLPAAEILLVDDGSTDRSLEIARSFGSRVSILPNIGRGVSAARNRASAAATGDFFQYLDADDLLDSHALASRVDALAASDGDVAISDWQRLVECDGSWKPGIVESGALPSGDAASDLKVFSGFWAPPAAILYRRSVWERAKGWRESLPVIQDARFLFDAARLGRPFVHVAGVGAWYRQRTSGSVSSSGAARFWSDVLRNSKEVETIWSETTVLDSARRDALARAYEDCARVGFVHDRGLFQDSRAELRRFRGFPKSRFVRTALMLTTLMGYRPARLALGAFCR